MIAHDGYVFLTPNGEYLACAERRDTADKWYLTKTLNLAHLFPFNQLDPIRAGQGFENIAQYLDIPLVKLNTCFTPIPAHTRFAINIGHSIE